MTHTMPEHPRTPENVPAVETAQAEQPTRTRSLSRRDRALGITTILFMILALWTVIWPTPYLVESPGPTFDTLGEIGGEPVITVDGAKTYDTSGRLDLTTVLVAGPPTSYTAALDVMLGMARGHEIVMPSAVQYPSQATAEDVHEENAVAMTTSQSWAVAAALEQLDVPYIQHLVVQDFVEGSPAEGILEPGDEVLAANDNRITGLEGLTSTIAEAGGDPVDITVLRDGEERTFEIPVQEGHEPDTWQIGVYLIGDFEFPIDVEISLESVGGPSAGMMFALGLIDKLTEEDLAAGQHIAGTGTIDPDGTVGAIGGIVQKVYGAHEEGASVFLAPEDNCPELEGNVPDGIDVYAVDTLDTAVTVLEELAQDDQPDASIPRCG